MDTAAPESLVEEVAEAEAGEHTFFSGVRNGVFMGVVLGVLMGVLVSLSVRAVYPDLTSAMAGGIIIGSLTGGVFLGISIAVGLHSKDLMGEE